MNPGKDSRRPTSQMNLLVRILLGSYLVYLAFDLHRNLSQSPVYLIAMVVFGLVGVVLVVWSIRRLLRGEFDYLDSQGNIIVPDELPEEEADFQDEEGVSE